MTPVPNLIAVRNFLNLNATKPVTMPEINEFWKSCSEEERKQFGAEAFSLMSPDLAVAPA